MSFEPETNICPKCKRQGCSTPESSFDSEHMLSIDWTCKCGHEIYHETRKPNPIEYTEGERGSLLDEINQFGALLGKSPIRMRK